MRGYPFSEGKALAILCHIPWNTLVEPVKWIPAKSGFASAVSVISESCDTHYFENKPTQKEKECCSTKCRIEFTC